MSDFHEMIVTVTKTSNRIIKLMLLQIPVTSRGFEMQTSYIKVNEPTSPKGQIKRLFKATVKYQNYPGAIEIL